MCIDIKIHCGNRVSIYNRKIKWSDYTFAMYNNFGKSCVVLISKTWPLLIFCVEHYNFYKLVTRKNRMNVIHGALEQSILNCRTWFLITFGPRIVSLLVTCQDIQECALASSWRAQDGSQLSWFEQSTNTSQYQFWSCNKRQQFITRFNNWPSYRLNIPG